MVVVVPVGPFSAEARAETSICNMWSFARQNCDDCEAQPSIFGKAIFHIKTVSTHASRARNCSLIMIGHLSYTLEAIFHLHRA